MTADFTFTNSSTQLLRTAIKGPRASQRLVQHMFFFNNPMTMRAFKQNWVQWGFFCKRLAKDGHTWASCSFTATTPTGVIQDSFPPIGVGGWEKKIWVPQTWAKMARVQVCEIPPTQPLSFNGLLKLQFHCLTQQSYDHESIQTKLSPVGLFL